MKRAVVALGIFAFAGILAAQSPMPWVSISQGSLRASVSAEQTEPYDGGPWAAIPARPLHPESQVTAKLFRIRAWMEDAKYRVLVYAVTEEVIAEANSREKESLAATFLLDRGQSIEVTTTEKYGAAHVILSVVDR